jgi:hypothetical protein
MSKKIHFSLDVSVYIPKVFWNQMSLVVFDTQLGAQGMDGIGEL